MYRSFLNTLDSKSEKKYRMECRFCPHSLKICLSQLQDPFEMLSLSCYYITIIINSGDIENYPHPGVSPPPPRKILLKPNWNQKMSILKILSSFIAALNLIFGNPDSNWRLNPKIRLIRCVLVKYFWRKIFIKFSGLHEIYFLSYPRPP